MTLIVNGELYDLPTDCHFVMKGGRYFFTALRTRAKQVGEDLKEMFGESISDPKEGDLYCWELLSEVTEFKVIG